jgi:predicted MPP superfamily phosphohydrolase
VRSKLDRLKPVLLICLLAQAAAQTREPFFFIQASDPQFGMYADNQDFAQETANFEFFVATANRLRPAFVVVTGDLVNKPGDPTQTAEYLRIAAKLDKSIPIYHVPGNHDVGNEPTAQSLAAYRAKFGKDYYTFRAGGTAFFVLNSSVIYAPRQVPQELDKQESWFKTELDKARRDGVKRMVVFQHHPWFLLSADEKDEYFNIPRERRSRFLGMMRDAGVTQVFAGHYHGNLVTRSGPIEMVTTGPVGRPRGGVERSGFRIVIVRESGIEHAYYDFGALPNRIELARPQPPGSVSLGNDDAAIHRLAGQDALPRPVVFIHERNAAHGGLELL